VLFMLGRVVLLVVEEEWDALCLVNMSFHCHTLIYLLSRRRIESSSTGSMRANTTCLL
jgi:hypothetical protein